MGLVSLRLRLVVVRIGGFGLRIESRFHRRLLRRLAMNLTLERWQLTFRLRVDRLQTCTVDDQFEKMGEQEFHTRLESGWITRYCEGEEW